MKNTYKIFILLKIKLAVPEHSFVFRNCFILVRVTVDTEPYPRNIEHEMIICTGWDTPSQGTHTPSHSHVGAT